MEPRTRVQALNRIKEVIQMLKIILRAARVNARLKQSEVEAATGFARSTLTSWESGNTSPRMADLRKLCGLYGVETGDIRQENTNRKRQGGVNIF